MNLVMNMAYDLEKYRDKREKVLGVKKRGISFGTLALIVSLTIVGGMGMVVIPKSVSYFHARHLDDVIYKLQGEAVASPQVISEVQTLHGVQDVVGDANGKRIVITYNKSETDAAKLSAFFKQKGLQVVLLNQVSHSQRMHTLKKEARF